MAIISRDVSNPVLVSLVARLWWSTPAADAGIKQERILPTGRAQIIMSAGTTGGVLVGPKSRSADIELLGTSQMVGVSFHAGGIQPFIPIPVVELTDQTIDLKSIRTFRCLSGDVAGLGAEAAFDLIEQTLAKLLRPGSINHEVLAAEQAIRAGIPASSVPLLLGVDRRLLAPEFRRMVGVGPKHYERIQRFSRSTSAMRQPKPKPLALIAAECGYADQAHLNREMRHFAGVTPSLLLGDATDTPNHIDSDKIFKTQRKRPARMPA